MGRLFGIHCNEVRFPNSLWTIFGLNYTWLVAWNVPKLHIAIDYSVDDINTFVLNLKNVSTQHNSIM